MVGIGECGGVGRVREVELKWNKDDSYHMSQRSK